MTLIWQEASLIHRNRIIADIAYDVEHNHVLYLEKPGNRLSIIPLNFCNNRKWLSARYPCQMGCCFFKKHLATAMVN
jgi:hypothetical protein